MKKDCKRLWARAVKLRDRLSCQQCGKSVPLEEIGLLEAHHLSYKARANYRVVFAVAIGECLCHTCHRIAHEDEEAHLDKIPGRVSPGRWRAIWALRRASKLPPRSKPNWQRMKARLNRYCARYLEEYEDNLDNDYVRGARTWRP